MYTTCRLLTTLTAALLLLVSTAAGAADYRLSTGQTVYVPVYSNIFTAPKAIPYHLAAILSIRNTDPYEGIEVLSADFYDTDGRLIHKHLTGPKKLRPLESTHIYLPEKSAGGVGANFLVRWQAASEVNVPIIECVMIGATSGQGISFVSPGQVIREVKP